MSAHITDRQRVFLAAVGELSASLGRPPNASEVATRLGITRVGARQQLRALEAKGMLADVTETVVVSTGRWTITPAGRDA